MTAFSPMLQRCKELLQQDCSYNSSPVLMLGRGHTGNGVKHGKDDPWHVPLYMDGIWRFLYFPGMLRVGAPIAGIGQGNGVGLQIWAAISSPLFEILWSEGFFALLIGVISGHSQNLAGFAFVDNTDLIVMDTKQNVMAVATWMQDTVAEWEALYLPLGVLWFQKNAFGTWSILNSMDQSGSIPECSNQ